MDKKEKIVEEAKFSKFQLLLSKKYKFNKDILEFVLEDDRQYSFTEVDGLLKKFMKGKVK